MKGYVAVQKKLLTIIYALWKKDEAFAPTYEHELVRRSRSSGEKEVAPYLATAVETPGSGIEQELGQKQSQKVIPAIETGITQDSHPSKNRRLPSLAEADLTT